MTKAEELHKKADAAWDKASQVEEEKARIVAPLRKEYERKVRKATANLDRRYSYHAKRAEDLNEQARRVERNERKARARRIKPWALDMDFSSNEAREWYNDVGKELLEKHLDLGYFGFNSLDNKYRHPKVPGLVVRGFGGEDDDTSAYFAWRDGKLVGMLAVFKAQHAGDQTEWKLWANGKKDSGSTKPVAAFKEALSQL